MLFNHRTKNWKYFLLLLAVFVYTPSFAQGGDSRTGHHHNGELSIGFNASMGYNILNHVDGTFSLIPNKIEPKPSPGSPVYASPLSVSIGAPSLSLEYWFSPSWALKFDTGPNLIVAGADHALSDFAYLLTYWRVNTGGRYYFADVNVDPLFIGLGWFASFPMGKPWIGFMQSDAKARIATGPYFEIGMNYSVTKLLNIELFGRFYLGLRALTLKSDPEILTNIALSSFDVGFGLNWSVL